MKSTLDSIFKVAFGVELDSMCGSSEEGTNFSQAFDDSSAMTLWRYVDLSWQIKKYLNIGSEALLKKNIEVVDAFVYKLIHSKIEQMHNPQDNSSVSQLIHSFLIQIYNVKLQSCNIEYVIMVRQIKKDDILSRFLQVTETDPKYLRDIILFIIAGKDTTATSLSWFIYVLCKHPEVQEKVAQEVKEAMSVTDITNFNELADSISEEALEKMPYLHAAITETLRLYPAVPVVIKILGFLWNWNQFSYLNLFSACRMLRYASLMILCQMGSV